MVTHDLTKRISQLLTGSIFIYYTVGVTMTTNKLYYYGAIELLCWRFKEFPETYVESEHKSG